MERFWARKGSKNYNWEPVVEDMLTQNAEQRSLQLDALKAVSGGSSKQGHRSSTTSPADPRVLHYVTADLPWANINYPSCFARAQELFPSASSP